jgi:hypothetical protein
MELLAELEKDLAELQTTIAVIKRRLGVSSHGNSEPSPTNAVGEHVGHGKPYLGMSILEASRKFLLSVREPKTPSEIADALKQGGVHSRSTDFNGIVRTTLFKRGHEAKIEKFGGGRWGLQDWRPGRSNRAAESEDEQA